MSVKTLLLNKAGKGERDKLHGGVCSQVSKTLWLMQKGDITLKNIQAIKIICIHCDSILRSLFLIFIEITWETF